LRAAAASAGVIRSPSGTAMIAPSTGIVPGEGTSTHAARNNNGSAGSGNLILSGPLATGVMAIPEESETRLRDRSHSENNNSGSNNHSGTQLGRTPPSNLSAATSYTLIGGAGPAPVAPSASSRSPVLGTDNLATATTAAPPLSAPVNVSSRHPHHAATGLNSLGPELGLHNSVSIGSFGTITTQDVGDPSGLSLKTDCYALGMVLYEIISGVVPFELTRGGIQPRPGMQRSDTIHDIKHQGIQHRSSPHNIVMCI
jgi:hypothetical protein